MNHEKIKNDYIKKISELKKLNKSYYQNNQPLITDSEFDKLKKDILNLEKKYKFLNHKD